MAGAGKKTFVAGAVLTASDVNTYLMDQAVMRFATASARSTALPTPSEGMMSYLDSTNAVEVYDGASWTSVTGTEIPHAMSALQASIAFSAPSYLPPQGLGGAININWPSGKFSVAPVVQVTNSNKNGGVGQYGLIFIPETVTSSTAAIYIWNTAPSGGASAQAAFCNITAVQMTSGSATG